MPGMSVIWRLRIATLCGLMVCLASNVLGQTVQQEGDSPILVGDSGVGYVDSAVLGDQMRVRFESAYGIDQANRAEFIWAWRPPLGDGPSAAESEVDYQQLTYYLEKQWLENVSLFAEFGGILSNPVINNNSGGFGDLNLGTKLALWMEDDSLTTAQVRVYVPSGDESRGLGTGHVSMEPALLHFRRLNSIWTNESEFRYFFPIGGTENKRGPIVRYGTGLSCLLHGCGDRQLRAVTEFVGWSVLDGQAEFSDGLGGSVIEDADGDTIINAKLGLRWKNRCHSLYAGYGRALTGDVWYQDVLRLEWRRTF
jgi:Putative MetA-pathway of phenol degradation